MASSLRVNAIVPASGTNVAIGTAGGTITYTASVSGVSTFSSGIVVSAGTTAAPSISPTGDSNTGIFFPSADTIAFAEGGVEALRIDSNANIGIGTNNPSQKLEVVGGEIKAGRVDTGSEGGQVSFGRATDNATGWYIDVYGNTSTPSLRFVDVSNAAVRMTVDSSGRVTKPFQPYFYARTGRTGADGYTNNPYRFEDVLHNVGGHFVTSGTGAYERFVAPVAGIYCFQSSPGYKQTSVDWNVRIRINGTEYAEIGRFIGSPSSHSTIGGSVTLKLSANDYVDLNNGGSAYHINTTFNFFCGYLLG
jgi:hypothetical protein